MAQVSKKFGVALNAWKRRRIIDSRERVRTTQVASSCGTPAPLTDNARVITGSSHDLADGHILGSYAGSNVSVSVVGRVAVVETGQQISSAGRAEGRRIGTTENHSTLGKGVNVGSVDMC